MRQKAADCMVLKLSISKNSQNSFPFSHPEAYTSPSELLQFLTNPLPHSAANDLIYVATKQLCFSIMQSGGNEWSIWRITLIDYDFALTFPTAWRWRVDRYSTLSMGTPHGDLCPSHFAHRSPDRCVTNSQSTNIQHRESTVEQTVNWTRRYSCELGSSVCQIRIASR